MDYATLPDMRVERGVSRGDLRADDDSSKDQLAFVSGYILVSGFAVLKLWPLAAGFQTGMSVNFWSMNLPSQGVNTILLVFVQLTFALETALTAVALAVCHILCYGLKLAFSSVTSEDSLVDGMRRWLDQLRQITYEATFLLLYFAGVQVVFFVLMIISAGLEGALVSDLSLSLKVAGWTSRLLVVLAPLLIVLIYSIFKLHSLAAKFLKGDKVHRIALITAFVVFGAMSNLVIQTCYTADLNVAGRIFQRSRRDLIEVEMTLGGSTSALNLVQFKLADSRGMPVTDLSPQDLGEGHYLSIIQSRDLQAGRYQVTLEYPHSSLDSSFPFLHKRIVTRRWFVVTP